MATSRFARARRPPGSLRASCAAARKRISCPSAHLPIAFHPTRDHLKPGDLLPWGDAENGAVDSGTKILGGMPLSTPCAPANEELIVFDFLPAGNRFPSDRRVAQDRTPSDSSHIACGRAGTSWTRHAWHTDTPARVFFAWEEAQRPRR